MGSGLVGHLGVRVALRVTVVPGHGHVHVQTQHQPTAANHALESIPRRRLAICVHVQVQ